MVLQTNVESTVDKRHVRWSFKETRNHKKILITIGKRQPKFLRYIMKKESLENITLTDTSKERETEKKQPVIYLTGFIKWMKEQVPLRQRDVAKKQLLLREMKGMR